MDEGAALVAILAGGAGERLGGSKPLVALGGGPLISRTIEAARSSALPVIVVAKPSVTLPELGCEVLHEPEQPLHPLCGLLAALAEAARRPGRPAVVAVGCDMPFLTGELLAWLATCASDGVPARAVVARIEGRLQPLLARYSVADAPALAVALREERSLRAAVLGLRPAIAEEGELARFGEPRRLCFNVNTREDLRAAQAWIEADVRDEARAERGALAP